MPKRTGSGLRAFDLLGILRIDRLTQRLKKARDFFMHYSKSYEINKKNIFLLSKFELIKSTVD